MRQPCQPCSLKFAIQNLFILLRKIKKMLRLLLPSKQCVMRPMGLQGEGYAPVALFSSPV